MKEFVLEYGQQSAHESGEFFRDPVLVEKLMGDVLFPFVYGQDVAGRATRILLEPGRHGQGLPRLWDTLYQFCTDFISLYRRDIVHASAFLAPPPIACKHIWDNFGHVMRTTRAPAEAILPCDVSEYLWLFEITPRSFGGTSTAHW